MYLIGMYEALLLARLVARALAARPDNLAFQILYGVTDPPVSLLRLLDVHQPRFGAVLELSTLALLLLLPVLGYGLWRLAVNYRGVSYE